MAILRTLPAAVAVAALTATLVGCGSNEVRDERDEARMERDAALAAQAAEERARMEAEAARAASDAAAAADDAAQMEAEAERDALQAENDRRAADQMAREMAAREVMSRVRYEALGGAADGSVGTTLDTSLLTVTATVDGIRYDENDDPDTADDRETTPAADDDTALSRTMMEATMMGSWTGAEYRRVEYKSGSNPRSEVAVTDTAMVYTNRGAPTVESKPVFEKHNDVVDHSVLRPWDSKSQFIAGPEFAAVSGIRTHDANRAQSIDSDTPTAFFETRGTFDGAPGTYRCTFMTLGGADGNTCASRFNGEGGGITLGTVSNSTGAFTASTSADDNNRWAFIPDAGIMTMTRREVADGTYGVYGWWLRDSVDTGEQVGTFAFVSSAVDVSLPSTFAALQGSATYMGQAAGQYALLPGLAGPTGDAGHFTADVMLEANWGDDTAGETLSGTVDGFMGADGMARDWSVELPETALRPASGETDRVLGNATRETTRTIWTMGGVAAEPAGWWTAVLVEAMTESRTGTPAMALGEFTAEHGLAIGRMVGAFGAELQPPE